MAHQDASDGSAYYLSKPEIDLDLVSVAKGTPGGELLRRYWHPIALANEVGDLPVPIRALGEDLILFKTPRGEFGLVYPRCCHRGTTLYYAKVEDRGIRCCYHGWLFAPDGKCLDQPCEPHGGEKRETYRQPWYPVQERYGLVFAFMGPPNRKPILPKYEDLEVLRPGESVVPDGNSLGSGGDVIAPCNWFQHWENVMDPYHVAILHSAFSGIQFVPEMAQMPEVSFEQSPLGVLSTQVRMSPTMGLGNLFFCTARRAIFAHRQGHGPGWQVSTTIHCWTVLEFGHVILNVLNPSPQRLNEAWKEIGIQLRNFIARDLKSARTRSSPTDLSTK